MLMANPISHAIGMLGALLIPIDRGRPVHLLDLWDPAMVLDLMISEDLNTGGGAPYFLTSLLDHPDFTQAHLDRMEHQGLGGAPVPKVIMERATDLGIRHLQDVWIDGAPVDHGLHVCRRTRQATCS